MEKQQQQLILISFNEAISFKADLATKRLTPSLPRPKIDLIAETLGVSTEVFMEKTSRNKWTALVTEDQYLKLMLTKVFSVSLSPTYVRRQSVYDEIADAVQISADDVESVAEKLVEFLPNLDIRYLGKTALDEGHMPIYHFENMKIKQEIKHDPAPFTHTLQVNP